LSNDNFGGALADRLAEDALIQLRMNEAVEGISAVNSPETMDAFMLGSYHTMVVLMDWLKEKDLLKE
jgi:hypothetical protein